MAGYIKLQEAHGHGVSYENVVIMCDDNRHSIVKTPSLEPEEDHIPAPQALARPEANVERITSGFTPGKCIFNSYYQLSSASLNWMRMLLLANNPGFRL